MQLMVGKYSRDLLISSDLTFSSVKIISKMNFYYHCRHYTTYNICCIEMILCGAECLLFLKEVM